MTDCHPMTATKSMNAPTEKETTEPCIKPQPRIRDDVFWTELEIRRLSNLVAEGINSRRYIGTSLSASEERQQMRVYIDAMKRKALRVLHRAELFAGGIGQQWLGIDKSIADPVSLANEYVKLVEDYLGVVSAEEERVRREAVAEVEVRGSEVEQRELEGWNENTGGIGEVKQGEDVEGNDRKEEWEKEDEEALKKAREESTESTRSQLLSGAESATSSGKENTEGMRRRRGETSNVKETEKEMEEMMKQHQPVQDELTTKLVDIVGQLKESVTENRGRLDKDEKVLDETEDSVDKNVTALEKQRKQLGQFSISASTFWWRMIMAVVVIIFVFVFSVLLLIVPM